MKLLILGCGDVGTAFGKIAVTRGADVTAIRRDITKLPDMFNNISADISEPTAFDAIPVDDYDAIAYTAAAGQYAPEAYEKAYVTGLQNTLAWLDKNNITPKRILFTSSTGVYHQDNGEWVDETSETKPTRFSGEKLLAAETLLAESKHDTVVVRYSGIYGPGRYRMLTSALADAGDSVETLHYTNRIHRDDCANVLWHLLNLENPHPVYIATDNNPAPKHEVTAFVRGLMGAEVIAPIPSHKKNRKPQNKRCRNQLLLESGYEFKYPSFREGYREVVAAYLKEK